MFNNFASIVHSKQSQDTQNLQKNVNTSMRLMFSISGYRLNSKAGVPTDEGTNKSIGLIMILTVSTVTVRFMHP